jgi:hypothetical protein
MAEGSACAAGRAHAVHRRAHGLGRHDPAAQVRIAAFLQGLAQLGWTVDRNVHIEIRWAKTDTDDLRKQAAEPRGRDIPQSKSAISVIHVLVHSTLCITKTAPPVSSMHMPARAGKGCHAVSRDRNRFRETGNLNQDQLVILKL